MTEKRYSRMTNHYGTSRTYCTGVYDNQNNRELKNASQVITELNRLSNENMELEKENEEFNEELMEYDSFKRLYEKKIEKLEKENEQLKLTNELLERDLYYCAKQFKEDVKNILLDLKGGLND